MGMGKGQTKLSGTDLLHGDEDVHNQRADVAPPISVATTFRYSTPDDLPNRPQNLDLRNPSRHVYSRYTQENSTRAEHILSKINKGYALTYASGLAASFAALLFYNPERIAISGGYHGVHESIEVYRKVRQGDVKVIELDEPFQEGDLCWLETPLNPTGESRNIQFYADKIHAARGHLIVDSTFAPPPLQYPFNWGADCILHSGTKYFGGHSDVLCGVLVVKTIDDWYSLWHDRTFTGNTMGSLESWLLLRSLRTLHLRVSRQSETATLLANWLHQLCKLQANEEWDGVKGGLISKVWHSSLQAETADWDLKGQMEGGYNATFSILLKNEDIASLFPQSLRYFTPATSLGGVESLVEQRVISDPSSDPRLIRISVGLEDLEDLKSDIRQALKKITQTLAKL